MQMDSFIYLGEYSTGCVCKLRGAPQGGGAGASAGSGAGAVGVVMQMRAAEARRSADTRGTVGAPSPR